MATQQPTDANATLGLYNTSTYTGQWPIPDQLQGQGLGQQVSWEAYLLNKIGVPINATNIAVLHYWTLSEDSTGNFNGGNNPLAICGASCPGVTGCVAQCGPGECPISKYSTLQQGLDCTAWFILGQKPSARTSGPMHGLINAFMMSYDSSIGQPRPQSMAIIFNAINISGWCSGCQGGHYPIQVYQALGKNPDQIIKDVAGAATPQLNAGAGVVQNVANAASSAFGGFDALTKLLGTITSVSFWKRVGLGALGIFMLIVGGIFILSETKAGQTVESTAVSAGTAAAMA